MKSMMGHGPRPGSRGRSLSQHGMPLQPQCPPPPHVLVRRSTWANVNASGTSAVAIDNKIEQAMDLVKSHLMFAVREEVEVLKDKIAELMDRINQLEVENSILKAHATQETLAQLTVSFANAAAAASASQQQQQQGVATPSTGAAGVGTPQTQTPLALTPTSQQQDGSP